MSKNKTEAFETFEFDLPPIRGFPELRWAGKRPFTSTQYFPAQKKEAYGDPTDGWWNRLYWGDNLQVMSHLLREFRGSIPLIYLDPPFASDADYKKRIKLRSESIEGDHGAFEEKQYGDIWVHDNYNQFIFDRLVLARELLSDGGTIYVQCDYRKSHHIRCILDEIFGPNNIINEIIWKRTTTKNDYSQGAYNWPRIHETLLYYCKGNGKPAFEQPFAPYEQSYIDSKYGNMDADGRRYMLDNLTAPGAGTRGHPQYELMGVTRYWRYNREKMEKLVADGRVVQPSPGAVPRYKRYLDEMPGVAIGDVFADINAANSQAEERVDYPTQKPEALLERVIKASSRAGDIVFDCFMGSGTTQAVAMRLGRRFIGADINLGAVETSIKRLNILRSSVGLSSDEKADSDSNKKLFTGFEVYNVNDYDLFRNPVEAKELIKDAMELQPLPSDSIFDGQRDQHLVKIMPVNRIATRQDLNEVINGLDFKAFERRAAEAPSKPVERIHLVCMGHEPDLAAELQKAAKPFDIEVLVTDLIRDKAHLHFKRASEARLAVEDGHLVVTGFYPMNLLQKLSMEADPVEDWRQLVESIKVDWNYDGAVLTPAIVDAPERDALVTGRYPIPDDAATIRVKITDLLSESWEGEIENG